MKTTAFYNEVPDPETTPEQAPAESPQPEIPQEDPTPFRSPDFPAPDRFPAENPSYPSSPEFPGTPMPAEIQRF